MQPPELSILIVNWNTRDLLKACLVSLHQNPPRRSFEICVVDNASTDDSLKMLQNDFPQVQVIPCKENLGFARANNLAFEQSKGKFLCILNSDTLLKPSALDLLMDFLQANTHAGAVGPTLRNADNSLQISAYPFPTVFRELWRLFHLDILLPLGVYPQEQWSTIHPRRVDALKGACIVFPRLVIEKVGFFDPAFFMYTEEIDLCYRIHKAGYPLFWLPQAEVIHLGGQSTRLAADQMFLSLYHTKILFFRKHYGKFITWLYKAVIVLASLPRLLLRLIAIFEPPERKSAHLLLARQYFTLITSLPAM